MDFIQAQVHVIQRDIKAFVDNIDSRWDEIIKDKDAMALETHRFVQRITATNQQFIDNTSVKLREEGFRLQNQLLSRIEALESRLDKQGERIKTNEMDIKLMSDKIEEEYKEFARNRKRWKSEFGLANDKADGLMKRLRQMLDYCMSQNQHNASAIKMMLDTQMIDHLIQRQDVEDRKQVLLMATGGDQPEPIPSDQLDTTEPAMPVDLQSAKTNETLRVAPRPSTNQVDQITLGTSDIALENRDAAEEVLQGITAARVQVESRDPPQPLFEMPKYQGKERKKQRYNEKGDPLAPFTRNAGADPAILKVDTNCAACSGNSNMSKNMTAAYAAFKNACLVYSASPIPYNNKNYHVSELLSVKASVVAQCQRLVRESIFGTSESYGIDIRNENNEKGFVIEPMLRATPILPRNPKAQGLLDDVTKAGENSYKLSQDLGATSNMQSMEEAEASSILKVSRYPEDIADDFRPINSFGASIVENEIEAVAGPSNPTAKPRNKTTAKGFTERKRQGSSQMQSSAFGVTQPTIPSLSLQQRHMQ